MKSLPTLAVLGFFLSFPALISAQDKKLTTVNVGYSAISGSFAPLWVGFDQGAQGTGERRLFRKDQGALTNAYFTARIFRSNHLSHMRVKRRLLRESL